MYEFAGKLLRFLKIFGPNKKKNERVYSAQIVKKHLLQYDKYTESF